MVIDTCSFLDVPFLQRIVYYFTRNNYTEIIGLKEHLSRIPFYQRFQILAQDSRFHFGIPSDLCWIPVSDGPSLAYNGH